VTSGPGVTNAVTGIATAYMDSIPDGDHFRPGADRGHRPGCLPGSRYGRHHPALREAQLPGQGCRDLASTIKKAFYIAQDRPPGPVLVDIPKDITRQVRIRLPEDGLMRSYNPVVKGHQGQIKKAVQLLLEAKRPMIYTGGGVVLSDAAEKLTEAGAQLGFPVHQHPDGPGRLSRRPTSSSWACSACTAPTKPTWPCSTATCCWPWAPASTTA
jgi:acetolactate synthase-1/2/3 large subunit